jgi:hypothetical protein
VIEVSTTEQAGLFTTLDEANKVNPYTLAQRWADVASRPIRVPAEVAEAKGLEVRTLAHELDELATVASLAESMNRRVPISIHHAILAGGTVDQAAAAAGMTSAQAVARWREWSSGQRRLWARYPDLAAIVADEATHDRVEQILVNAARQRAAQADSHDDDADGM